MPENYCNIAQNIISTFFSVWKCVIICLQDHFCIYIDIDLIRSADFPVSTKVVVAIVCHYTFFAMATEDWKEVQRLAAEFQKAQLSDSLQR